MRSALDGVMKMHVTRGTEFAERVQMGQVLYAVGAHKVVISLSGRRQSSAERVLFGMHACVHAPMSECGMKGLC